jgi:hypothetical protein
VNSTAKKIKVGDIIHLPFSTHRTSYYEVLSDFEFFFRVRDISNQHICQLAKGYCDAKRVQIIPRTELLFLLFGE